MALFIQRDENRSQLQEKLAAELREKAKTRAAREDDRPDGVDDSQYLVGTKKTTSLAWAWVVVVVLILIAIAVIILNPPK
jgi:basic membrane lipoprotein Med (substrate-binding protein (PBP1-ABC) superfamily)